ncbi:MAG TPA: carbohydrate ABC transporter permease [Devosiaceae bacterium]|jgi:multiple sugar transport system permease protein
MQTLTRGQLAALLGAIAVTVVVLFPIYWMIVTSILPTSTVLSRNPPLLPPLDQVNLEAYFEVLARKPILKWMTNSAFVALGSMVISLVVSIMAGYSLSRYRTVAQQVAGFTLLASKMLPSTLVVIPFFVMFTTFHMINSPWALMLANASVGVPFATWMMKGFFDSIPRELEQAAMVDGCTPLLALWKVVLPLARPGVSAAAIYLAIVSWSDLVFARTLAQKPDQWLLTVGLQSFIGEYQVEWANLMAAGALSLIPVVLLFIILEPFLVSGLTNGAVTS